MGECDTEHSLTFTDKSLHLQHTIFPLILLIDLGPHFQAGTCCPELRPGPLAAPVLYAAGQEAARLRVWGLLGSWVATEDSQG